MNPNLSRKNDDRICTWTALHNSLVRLTFGNKDIPTKTTNNECDDKQNLRINGLHQVNPTTMIQLHQYSISIQLKEWMLLDYKNKNNFWINLLLRHWIKLIACQKTKNLTVIYVKLNWTRVCSTEGGYTSKFCRVDALWMIWFVSNGFGYKLSDSLE